MHLNTCLFLQTCLCSVCNCNTWLLASLYASESYKENHSKVLVSFIIEESNTVRSMYYMFSGKPGCDHNSE